MRSFLLEDIFHGLARFPVAERKKIVFAVSGRAGGRGSGGGKQCFIISCFILCLGHKATASRTAREHKLSKSVLCSSQPRPHVVHVHSRHHLHHRPRHLHHPHRHGHDRGRYLGKLMQNLQRLLCMLCCACARVCICFESRTFSHQGPRLCPQRWERPGGAAVHVYSMHAFAVAQARSCTAP